MAYLTTPSLAVTLRAHVTSKARTAQSCRAFREGAAGVWPPAAGALACEDPRTESEGLLRPYAGCARLEAHRRAVVGAEEEDGWVGGYISPLSKELVDGVRKRYSDLLIISIRFQSNITHYYHS